MGKKTTTLVPTWKEYEDWCNMNNRNPLEQSGGNFHSQESRTDEAIKHLYEKLWLPKSTRLGNAVTAFFTEWEALPHDEISLAIARWQTFFSS